MKRMTVYLDSELGVLLKLESARSKRSMADLLREALRDFLARSRPSLPPGAGAFDSGHSDTAERHEELLGELGFGA